MPPLYRSPGKKGFRRPRHDVRAREGESEPAGKAWPVHEASKFPLRGPDVVIIELERTSAVSCDGAAETVSVKPELGERLVCVDICPSQTKDISGFQNLIAAMKVDIPKGRSLCLLFCSSNNYPEIQRLFPDAEIQHIPDAGHWVHADQPQEFITAVCNFIALHPL